MSSKQELMYACFTYILQFSTLHPVLLGKAYSHLSTVLIISHALQYIKGSQDMICSNNG